MQSKPLLLIPEGKTLVVFDGICNSCNFVVNFLLKIDKNEVFVFTAQQSEFGKQLMTQNKLSFTAQDTLVVFSDNKVFAFSSAVFQIFYILGWPWRLLNVFSFLPRVLTDHLYRAYANNRYKFFGKKESCRIPTENERRRFLNKI